EVAGTPMRARTLFEIGFTARRSADGSKWTQSGSQVMTSIGIAATETTQLTVQTQQASALVTGSATRLENLLRMSWMPPATIGITGRILGWKVLLREVGRSSDVVFFHFTLSICELTFVKGPNSSSRQ